MDFLSSSACILAIACRIILSKSSRVRIEKMYLSNPLNQSNEIVD